MTDMSDRPRYAKVQSEASLFRTTTKVKPDRTHQTILGRKPDQGFKSASPRSFTGKLVRAEKYAPRTGGGRRALASSKVDRQRQCAALVAKIGELQAEARKAYLAGEHDRAKAKALKADQAHERLEYLLAEVGRFLD